ncbi:MAG TPA: VacJ family lipoprotein [Verrucomicrobiae bacterium]|jgi:phospholipid-binding lipoprotein MlaA|nr:VacJ family lipoprotein [Verrucomicrobiae bacterium]
MNMTMDRRTVFSLVSALAMALAFGYGSRAWAVENDLNSGVLTVETDASTPDEAITDSASTATLEAYAAPADTEADVDPWEAYNEPVFRFNHDIVDRYVYKPVATAWDAALPDSFQRALHNAIDNLSVVRRVVNNLLQGKPARAGRELARFTINSTLGYVGFLDVAKEYFGIQQADEDFGQTLAVWGAKSGPYFVIPLIPPPTTVRDLTGNAVDGLMNPIGWAAPVGATFGILGVNIINERSLYLDRFEQVEESVVDLYSAVRNAYFQRRAAAIRE